MPYSKEHKLETREKILKSAVDLFCRKGFNNVSIDDLMQDAALTRGAFYAHFSSKGDVYRESITAAAKNTDILTNIPEGLENEALLSYFLDAYLNQTHVNQEISPCPMAFLVTDVANNEPKVKSTYTAVFKGLVNLIDNSLPEDYDDNQRRQMAFAISALAIGSVAIGRALDDETMQNQLLASSKQIAKLLAKCD